MKALLKRWRWWLLLTCAALAIYSLLPWLGFGKGLTLANARRIRVGMARQEVESILGSPNDIQARQSLEKLAQETGPTAPVKAALERRKTAGEFWDEFSYGDWGRYIAVSVSYDAEGKVDQTQISTFWRLLWIW